MTKLGMSPPFNVGIKALEIYFPSQYVEQAELEEFDGVSEGKYTIGLGQTRMSFCDDREDIYSISLTAVSSLIQKYNIDCTKIGRLEVGTETILDKSKSVKSVLMQLFTACGNSDIEGVDTVNACYSGTNALLNAVNWVKATHDTDGRDAIVVAGDIALYSKGNARPTGGVGCVAMLIGQNAPLVMEPHRGSHMQHVYDFYKPNLASEYPIVHGQHSLECYTHAVDKCHEAYLKTLQISGNIGKDGHDSRTLKRSHLSSGLQYSTPTANGHMNGSSEDKNQTTENNLQVDGQFNERESTNGTSLSTSSTEYSPMESFDFVCFHAPTCKLVSKAYARLFYNDFCIDYSNELFKDIPVHSISTDKKASLQDKNVEKIFLTMTKKKFEARVRPSLLTATMCGNMYSGSLYGGLASLLSNVPESSLIGKRIGMFSYGSGLASTLFSLKVVGSVHEIANKLDLNNRLERRVRVSPTQYDQMCELRAKSHLRKDYIPEGLINSISKGTYYLEKVDDVFRRSYSIKVDS